MTSRGVINGHTVVKELGVGQDRTGRRSEEREVWLGGMDGLEN